ncbi:thymidine kinase [Burkholderia ubonensis]|uniref:Thymidine kinase n=1 Tax=Burkholderia ubonensis TaxID=101571 RepID=A0AAW3MVF0_9BURK|nr:thymidine kinase [Burkholderia ubonensis]KVP75117.1 thymidine kinase [Burkholderia ubonensis]KVP97923.1 thymidine kinase [Burkholderia ubonensis]KVZ92620.1 thymidine kinase [Burkholderia ubonensis]
MSKLYFRYAAMNAGKSTQLLQIEFNYKSLGRHVQLLTAKVDNRFGEGIITSRLGIASDAEMFTPETDMFEVVKRYRESVTDETLGALLIDEAQFLKGEQVRDLHRAVHVFDVPVLAFGIRSDFQGLPFEGSAMLLTLAEDIEELKNVCSCGAKATMNMRVDAQGKRVRSGPQLLIGDATYRQVCGNCFYR